jgi:hypothetical protein
VDQRDDYRELDEQPEWYRRPRFRKVARLLIALLVAGTVVGVAAWMSISVRPTDRYYMVYTSIQQAEMLAKVCHLKSPDPRRPLTPADLKIANPRELADAWGNPYKWAVVPDPAGEPELHVWTEWVRDDGTTTLIGAKVRPDGTSVRFGLPPKD